MDSIMFSQHKPRATIYGNSIDTDWIAGARVFRTSFWFSLSLSRRLINIGGMEQDMNGPCARTDNGTGMPVKTMPSID